MTTNDRRDLELLIAAQGGVISAITSLLIESGTLSKATVLERLGELGKYDETPEEKAATSAVAGLLMSALRVQKP